MTLEINRCEDCGGKASQMYLAVCDICGKETMTSTAVFESKPLFDFIRDIIRTWTKLKKGPGK